MLLGLNMYMFVQTAIDSWGCALLQRKVVIIRTPNKTLHFIFGLEEVWAGGGAKIDAKVLFCAEILLTA